MTGVIWIIQIVHYPLYSSIDEDSFTKYQNRHIKLITPVVAPAMLVELISTTVLYFIKPGPILASGLVLVLIIWLNTAFQAIPTHRELSFSWQKTLYTKLLTINWIRTIAWTLRLFLMGYVIFSLVKV